MAKIDGLEIVMTKQMQKMIGKELKKRIEELKPELAVLAVFAFSASDPFAAVLVASANNPTFCSVGAL